MRGLRTAAILGFLCVALGCSPRDFLTRRLAAELISGSDAFKATQRFWLRTGPISNKDYNSPEYLLLQKRGWIAANNVGCPGDVSPPPCWDVTLTPLGVDTFRDLMQPNAETTSYFSVPVAKRELVVVTGISKSDATARVDFSWKWAPMNDVGSAIYPPGVVYDSSVDFRHYDDGWRLVENNTPRNYQNLDDALKNAEPEQ